MLDVETVPGLSMAIAGLLAGHAGELPGHTLAAVLEAQGQTSPYDRFVRTAEALYAAGDAAGPAGVGVCKALATFAQINFAPLAGPDGVGAPERAAGIVRACRRRLGELTPEEAPPAEDPEPLPAYLDA